MKTVSLLYYEVIILLTVTSSPLNDHGNTTHIDGLGLNTTLDKSNTPTPSINDRAGLNININPKALDGLPQKSLIINPFDNENSGNNSTVKLTYQFDSTTQQLNFENVFKHIIDELIKRNFEKSGLGLFGENTQEDRNVRELNPEAIHSATTQVSEENLPHNPVALGKCPVCENSPRALREISPVQARNSTTTSRPETINTVRQPRKEYAINLDFWKIPFTIFPSMSDIMGRQEKSLQTTNKADENISRKYLDIKVFEDASKNEKRCHLDEEELEQTSEKSKPSVSDTPNFAKIVEKLPSTKSKRESTAKVNAESVFDPKNYNSARIYGTSVEQSPKRSTTKASLAKNENKRNNPQQLDTRLIEQVEELALNLFIKPKFSSSMNKSETASTFGRQNQTQLMKNEKVSLQKESAGEILTTLQSSIPSQITSSDVTDTEKIQKTTSEINTYRLAKTENFMDGKPIETEFSQPTTRLIKEGRELLDKIKNIDENKIKSKMVLDRKSDTETKNQKMSVKTPSNVPRAQGVLTDETDNVNPFFIEELQPKHHTRVRRHNQPHQDIYKELSMILNANEDENEKDFEYREGNEEESREELGSVSTAESVTKSDTKATSKFTLATENYTEDTLQDLFDGIQPPPYFMSKTVPTFFGIGLVILFLCCCLRSGSCCCKLFQPTEAAERSAKSPQQSI